MALDMGIRGGPWGIIIRIPSGYATLTASSWRHSRRGGRDGCAATPLGVSFGVPFTLKSDFPPTGDQPEAIERLVESLRAGNRHQTLLGVTGSGKTFTMANVIARLDRPTPIITSEERRGGK